MVKMLKEKSLEDQVKKSIPANVLVISGAKADQMKSEVFDVDEFELPKNKGKQGGMLTSAWLQVMNRNATVTTEKITWVDMLKGTKQTLEEQGYNNQIPQVASSRKFSVKTEMLLFPKGGKKRALLIGIQYRDHGDGQLKNSHEQVEAMKQYLIKVHKFPKQKIDVLLDNDGSERDPTRKNILNSMRNLTKETQAGDTAFVLFCGHAGRIFGREDEETIIPVDFGSSGQIRQDEIYKALICAMPAKSNLVCLFDLANSGSLIDLPFVFKSKEEWRSELYENMGFELQALVGLAAFAAIVGIGVSGGFPLEGASDCCTDCCGGFWSSLFD